MVQLVMPADTVPFYKDGPEAPLTGPLQLVEYVYRKEFVEAVREVARWPLPNEFALAKARDARDVARLNAEVKVPSFVLYSGGGNAGRDAVVYREGHEVAAARARGRCQAMAVANAVWWALHESGMDHGHIRRHVIWPWVTKVEIWAATEIDTHRVTPPPRPDAQVPNRPRVLESQPAPASTEASKIIPPAPLEVKSVRQLINEHPELRRPVIHGLLREGETMNVIASPKVGKSWLVIDLALAVATGRLWLETFECERGQVLIIDNELHPETSAHRIPKVMDARGIAMDEAADSIHVQNVRGRLQDIFGVSKRLEAIMPRQYKLIVLDAFYRFMPKDTDENDNGTMSQVYNHIDALAARLGCSFVLVHHSSKGNQSGKSVTDVGAGAGSQSRATDTHLVLRPHEQDDVVVLDAAVRSWPPIAPRCLRWSHPIWTTDDSLDPAALRPERPRRRTRDAETKAGTKTTEPAWDASRFARAFVGEAPATILQIVHAATASGLSERKATQLLKQAESQGLIYRWRFGATQPVQLATIPQPETIS